MVPSGSVGGYQAKTPPVAHKRVSASKEVRHKIRIAVTLRMNLFEPVWVAVRIPFGHRVLSRERRITNDDVEPARRPQSVIERKHLGELDMPVKRHNRLVRCPQ